MDKGDIPGFNSLGKNISYFPAPKRFGSLVFFVMLKGTDFYSQRDRLCVCKAQVIMHMHTLTCASL